MIEQLQQRDDGDVGDSACARRGSERARHVMPPSNEAPLERGQPGAIDRRQRPLFDIHVRYQTAAESSDHRPALRPGGNQIDPRVRPNRRCHCAHGTPERGVQTVDHRLTRGSLGVSASIEQRSLIAKGAFTPQPHANRADPPLERRPRRGAFETRTRDDRPDIRDQPAPLMLILRILPKSDPGREQLLADEMAGFIDERHTMERDQRPQMPARRCPDSCCCGRQTAEPPLIFEPACFPGCRLNRD